MNWYHMKWQLQRTYSAKYRAEGFAIPKFYGLAYYHHDLAQGVYYPIPLHLLIRLWHWTAYWWMRRIKAVDWAHTPFDNAYRNGKYDGYNEGVASKFAQMLSESYAEEKRNDDS